MVAAAVGALKTAFAGLLINLTPEEKQSLPRIQDKSLELRFRVVQRLRLRPSVEVSVEVLLLEMRYLPRRNHEIGPGNDNESLVSGGDAHATVPHRPCHDWQRYPLRAAQPSSTTKKRRGFD